jgi:DNA-binding transcriptional MerR regulator
MSNNQTLDIAEVSRHSGVPASTLRFYEEKGLIISVGRQGLRRLFQANVLQRLELIALGQNVGFSLDEIGAMFTPKKVDIDKNLLLEKAAELDQNIQHLIAMRDGLVHAAHCPEPTLLECPKFLKILRITGKAKVKQEKQKKKSLKSGG